MSKTDKTRPWSIKVDELNAADPYGARRGGYPHAPGIYGCADSCWMCSGYLKEERKRERRQAKRATRDWEKEYE